MVGSHGAEIGEPATGAAILSDASRAALAALTAAWPRLLVETKPHGIAVHYRPEPEAAPAVFTVMDDMAAREGRSEEHTSELQSLMRISYAVFCLKKKKQQNIQQ